MNQRYGYYSPTKILFGKERLNDLNIQTLPGKNAMIVITNGKSTKENGYLDRLCKQLMLANINYHIFDRVCANPTKKVVMKGSVFAKEHSCDFIVALGGGSVIDASKAIAVMVVNSGDYWDYISSGTGKGKALEYMPLPIIAITT